MVKSSAGEGPRVAYILLVLATVFWGGTWVTGKVAVDAIPPLTLAATRFTIASALLYVWARTRGGAPHPLGVGDLPLVLGMGATAVALYNVLFLYGLKLAPASDGALIVPGLAPIFTAVMAWPLLGDKVSRGVAAGLLVGLAGLLLVISPGEAAVSSRLTGDVLFALGALCWAVYSVLGKVATARFTPLRATLYGSVSGTLLLLPFALAERGWHTLGAASLPAWLSLLYLAIFGTVLAFVFFYEGVHRIGAVRATPFAFLVPIIGVVTSVLALGERPRTLALAGGLLVLLGLWLVQRKTRVPQGELRVNPPEESREVVLPT